MKLCSIGMLAALLAGCAGQPSEERTQPVGADTASTSMTTDSLVGVSPGPVAAPDAIAVSPPIDTTPAPTNELAALAATLIIPVQGVIASQLHDAYAEARVGHVHEALDIMAPRGTPVISAADGLVLKLHKSVAGGNMVYAADVSDRYILMYGHLDRYADGVTEGVPIKQGQLLGYVGTTGNVPPGAPHLHFAVARGHPSLQWWKGVAMNPYPLFVGPLAPRR